MVKALAIIVGFTVVTLGSIGSTQAVGQKSLTPRQQVALGLIQHLHTATAACLRDEPLAVAEYNRHRAGTVTRDDLSALLSTAMPECDAASAELDNEYQANSNLVAVPAVLSRWHDTVADIIYQWDYAAGDAYAVMQTISLIVFQGRVDLEYLLTTQESGPQRDAAQARADEEDLRALLHLPASGQTSSSQPLAPARSAAARSYLNNLDAVMAPCAAGFSVLTAVYRAYLRGKKTVRNVNAALASPSTKCLQAPDMIGSVPDILRPYPDFAALVKDWDLAAETSLIAAQAIQIVVDNRVPPEESVANTNIGRAEQDIRQAHVLEAHIRQSWHLR